MIHFFYTLASLFYKRGYNTCISTSYYPRRGYKDEIEHTNKSAGQKLSMRETYDAINAIMNSKGSDPWDLYNVW